MMRTEEVVSASIWLAKVGRLTSTEKIKSDTAIERIVRIFLRLLRSRFLKIRVRYFVIFLAPVMPKSGAQQSLLQIHRLFPLRSILPCPTAKRFPRTPRNAGLARP